MRVFSTDHKVIGLQYAFTSLVFLLLGFLLIVLIVAGSVMAALGRRPIFSTSP